METDNSIKEKFDKLDKQWLAFLNSKRTFFHWHFNAGDQHILQNFVDMKNILDEDKSGIVVHLKTPFNTFEQYAWDLTNEMIHVVSEHLHEPDMNGNVERNIAGITPDIRRMHNGFQALFVCCQALVNQFDDVLQRPVLVIAPVEVKSSADYQQWWRSVCELESRSTEWPEKLRWVVADSMENPRLAAVFEDQAAHVCTAMWGMFVAEATEALDQEANGESDEDKVRKRLLDMNDAITKGDEDQLLQAAALAIPIAQANEWLDVWATILMTRAEGLLTAKQYERAIIDYRDAQAVAAEAILINRLDCNKLLLRALMGEGTAFFVADQLDNASHTYEKTALKAKEFKDLWMELEAWRMASVCLERKEEKFKAWECASRALQVGKSMNYEQRVESTLSLVGESLLRLSPNAQVKQEVKSEFDEYLGGSWLEHVENASAGLSRWTLDSNNLWRAGFGADRPALHLYN